MDKNIKSPLPTIFICTILIIAILNMSFFVTIYKTNIVEAEVTNKQSSLSSIETEYQDNVIGKTNYLDLNGLFSRLIDKKELNEVYKLNNGYLTSSLISYDDMNLAINNISNLKKYLDLYDIPFAYVQIPDIIPNDDDTTIPAGYETNVNGNSDRLLEGLENNYINYLDLRENFKEDNINMYNLYYPTDYHWTTEASFQAHKYVVQYIDEIIDQKNYIDEYLIDSRYSFDIMECNMLGSYGQRTGIFYAGVDKITYIHPNFYTNFNVYVPSRNYDRTGTFRETMSNESGFSLFNTRGGPESIYLFYNIDYRRIRNLNTKNDIKVLLINDSFSLTLAPFIALHYGEVHTYDVRSRFGGSVEDFIDKLHEIKPDIVLQIRTATNVLTNEAKALI